MPKHFPVTTLPLQTLVMQIVKLYARSLSKDLPKLKGWDTQEKQCKNILKVSALFDNIQIVLDFRSPILSLSFK